WLTPAAEKMQDEDWNLSFARSIMIFYNGMEIHEPDSRGERVTDDSLLILLNAAAEPVDFTIPDASYAGVWRSAIDTDPTKDEDENDYEPGDTLVVPPHTSIILVSPSEEDA